MGHFGSSIALCPSAPDLARSVSPRTSLAMAPMKVMKAMKATAKGGLTQTGVLSHVAEKTALKSKDVKAVVETLMGVAVAKLKKKPATKARKGVNPFTKEPCVFKAKPASKT